MIALTPQFASLLVAITASAVSAAPGPHSARYARRYVVLDVDVPGVAKVHLRPRTVSVASNFGRRSNGGVQHTEQPADVKAVFIQPPTSTAASTNTHPDQSSDTTGLASAAARRGFDEPIDTPDSTEQVHAEDADTALVDVFSTRVGVPRKRSMLRVDSQYGPGLIITNALAHNVEQITRSVAVRVLSRRGLLDGLLPILGSLPGVGGIIKLIGGTLSDVLGGLPILGPILGGLLLSPHQPASAQSIGDGSDSTVQYFLDASSTHNASTIYVVDSGHPTSLAIASQSNNTNTTSEHIVSLQMAFVNATNGQIQAYCATFDSTGNGQSALAARPCITDGMTTPPHASQSFGWNPVNKAVRPMWDDEARNTRRDYIVEAGSLAVASASTEGGDSKSVVLVFEPFSTPASTNSTEPDAGGKDATGAGPDAPSPSPAINIVEHEDEDDEVPVYVEGLYAA